MPDSRPCSRRQGCTFVALLLILAFSLSAHAQSTASCSFRLFPLNWPNSVNSVNNWGTVVGQVSTSSQMPPYGDGFIRYSNGSINYFSPQGSIGTWLNARNDAGRTVGWYFDSTKTDHGFLLQGSTMTPITDSDADPVPTSTRPTGINKWNTIVGQYVSKKYGNFWEGFKRYSDGSIVAIVYPGPRPTYPNAINDSGTVVGFYYDANYNRYGFIWNNGQWASLGSELLGISDTNIVLGIGSPDGTTFFLYKKGNFEDLPSVPNSSSTNYDGISPNGLITGRETDSAGQHGFVATCK